MADAPNDAGKAIVVEWPAAAGEREAAEKGQALPYSYVVSVSPEGGTWVELPSGPVPGAGGWKADIAGKFGVGAHWAAGHAVLVELAPLAAVQPAAITATATTLR
ncbi:MAG TPA: hypothetical protein VHF22_14170, partial [Planctomycetota bacterium]|nr:hypothetical protein [Planctomycetota bacterium]